MNASASPPRRRPTRRQLEVLRACFTAGSIAGAAHELGITDATARQHLSGLYRRTGCLNAAQAAYWLGRHEGRRTEVHSPATTDLPVTMRLAEPPEPLDWFKRA